MLALYALAGSGLVALAIVLGVIFLAGSDGDDESALAAKMSAAGCTLKHFPALAGTHVSLNAKVDYNSFPPTSGPHFGEWAVWNFYEEPVPPIQAVHNLEHGGIVIYYGGRVPQSTVDRIREFYYDDPNGLVVTPLAKLGNKIALTAWTSPPIVSGQEEKGGQGHLATCGRFDDEAFGSFRDAYRGKGPERFSVDSLTPGSL